MYVPSPRCPSRSPVPPAIAIDVPPLLLPPSAMDTQSVEHLGEGVGTLDLPQLTSPMSQRIPAAPSAPQLSPTSMDLGDTLDDDAIFDTVQMEYVHGLGCPHAVLELMPTMSKEVPNLTASRHADFMFRPCFPELLELVLLLHPSIRSHHGCCRRPPSATLP